MITTLSLLAPTLRAVQCYAHATLHLHRCRDMKQLQRFTHVCSDCRSSIKLPTPAGLARISGATLQPPLTVYPEQSPPACPATPKPWPTHDLTDAMLRVLLPSGYYSQTHLYKHCRCIILESPIICALLISCLVSHYFFPCGPS